MIEIYIIFLAILVITWLDQKRQTRRNREKALEKIRNGWGKLPENAFDEADLEALSKLFYSYDLNSSDKCIDDITWNDLELDKLYCQINSTETTMGGSVLYSILRMPVYEKVELNDRIELIDYWEHQDVNRQTTQLILASVGKFRPSYISSIIGNCSFLELDDKWVYKVLTFLPLLALPLLLVSIWASVLWIVFSCGANVVYHELILKKAKAGLEAITQASGIVQLAEKLTKKQPAGLEKKYAAIDGLVKILRPLQKKGTADKLSVTFTGDLFRDFFSIFNMILLKDIWNYQISVEFLKNHGENMAQLIKAVGELDATICIASYRKSLESWCYPQILWEETEGANIEAESTIHPLIKNCTPNPINSERPILLTGSNASGKSTYLKTVAMNTLLTHTFGFCLAAKWVSKPLFPVTSMALRDSVLNGESYFIAEIKSLKRIFRTLNRDITCLCVIDEVLRGTNTIERIAASSILLVALSKLNACILAATHDTELTDILMEIFENKHFEENITDNDIHFDYKLKDSKATSRNAIKLLKVIGFENDIINKAEEAVASFETTKRWNSIKGV